MTADAAGTLTHEVLACHAIVSDECRINRSNLGAANESVTRLFKSANDLMESWPIGKGAKLHFKLSVEYPAASPPGTDGSDLVDEFEDAIDADRNGAAFGLALRIRLRDQLKKALAALAERNAYISIQAAALHEARQLADDWMQANNEAREQAIDDQCRAAAAEAALASQAARMGEWQPIETAPKDGTTEYLFFHAKWSETTIGIRPIDCPDDAAADLMGTAYYPTHWQPLPAPPAAIDKLRGEAGP